MLLANLKGSPRRFRRGWDSLNMTMLRCPRCVPQNFKAISPTWTWIVHDYAFPNRPCASKWASTLFSEHIFRAKVWSWIRNQTKAILRIMAYPRMNIYKWYQYIDDIHDMHGYALQECLWRGTSLLDLRGTAVYTLYTLWGTFYFYFKNSNILVITEPSSLNPFELHSSKPARKFLRRAFHEVFLCLSSRTAFISHHLSCDFARRGGWDLRTHQKRSGACIWKWNCARLGASSFAAVSFTEQSQESKTCPMSPRSQQNCITKLESWIQNVPCSLWAQPMQLCTAQIDDHCCNPYQAANERRNKNIDPQNPQWYYRWLDAYGISANMCIA